MIDKLVEISPPLETQSSFADFGLQNAAADPLNANMEEEKKGDDVVDNLGEFRKSFVAKVKNLIEF